MIKIISAVVLLIAISLAGATVSYVEELDDDNFSSRIAEKAQVLVMFYAPWCGHCKKLGPDFEKAATNLVTHDEILLVKVDCTAGGKSTCEKHGVKGYPTLKIFQQSEEKWKDYTDSRDPDKITQYMKALILPASQKVNSQKDIQELSREGGVLVLIQSDDNSDLAKSFMSFAEKKRTEYKFAHTSNKDIVSKELKFDASEGIFLHRPIHLANKFEPTIIKFEGRSGDNMESFIKENIHGLVGHRKTDVVKDFKAPLIVAYYRVDYKNNPSGTHYWRNRVLMIAKDIKEKVTFGISAKDEFQHELNEFGYDYISGDKPVVVARDAKNLKYKMEDEFSVENLKKFVTEFLGGKLTPYIKSEDIPEDDDKPVKVAVAKNFDDVVINNGKDTLVEFYAPWCGHCKKLAPVFDELAEKLKNENIAIVKMDATANDIPREFNVQGFPTLYWLPKNAKDNPVSYDGGRQLDDFMKYIAKHATDELKGFDRKANAKKVEL